MGLRRAAVTVWARPGRDSLLVVGLLLCIVSVFVPWILRESGLFWLRLRPEFLTDVLNEMELRALTIPSDPDHPAWTPSDWWWCLPMVYGFAVPVVWCWSPKQWLTVRLWAAWSWWLGVSAALALVIGPSLGAVQTEEFVRASHVTVGPWFAGVGAVLIGLPPMLELSRLRRRRARWARRPGARQHVPAPRRHALPGSLEDLVHAATTLWSELGPQRPLDDGQAYVLTDLVGRLRRLGPAEQTWLDARGARVEAIVQTLAPGSERESWFDEVLRLDQGLGLLVTASRTESAGCPYR